MATLAYMNSEPSGSPPDPAVATAKKSTRADVSDASEIADTQHTFRVGSGAMLLLSLMIATLLSYASSPLTQLKKLLWQTRVWTLSIHFYRVIQSLVSLCRKAIVLLVLVYVIQVMNVTESMMRISSRSRTSEYAQLQQTQPRPNKRRRLLDTTSRKGLMTPQTPKQKDPLDTNAKQHVEAKDLSGMVASGTGAVSASDSPDFPLLSTA